MGGSSHHHHHHKATNNGSNRSSSSSSGKPYGLMLLLAFGAALLGVMVLHKLRERRIFGLLVKEKDSQLISLQLLFQKENEYGKELKRKNEEMKAKLYLLRTQKMELERRVLEMQSTIDSLNDEQKAIESALEEKQNEIKTMQRELIDASKENAQVTDLKEMLKLKEAVIEDLRRRRLENPVKVWSVSTDDLSKPHLNFTDTPNVSGNDKSATSSFIDSKNFTSVVVDGSSEKTVGGTNNNSRVIPVARLENLDVSQDEGSKNGDVRRNFGTSLEKIVEDEGVVFKPGGNSSEVKEKRKMENIENPEEAKQEVVRENSKGGTKLEMQDARTRLRGKHVRQSRTKEKRWRIVAKARVSEDNAAASLRSRGLRRSERKGTAEEDAELVKANPEEDAEHMESRDENADPNKQPPQENESSNKSQNSPDREVLMERSVNDTAYNISAYAGKQDKQPEEEARDLQQNLMISQNNSQQENEAKQVKVDEKRQMMMRDNREAANEQDSDTEATNGGSLNESTVNLEGEEEAEEEIKDEYY